MGPFFSPLLITGRILEIWSSQFRQRAGTGDAISKFRFKKASEFVGQNFERFRTKKLKFLVSDKRSSDNFVKYISPRRYENLP